MLPDGRFITVVDADDQSGSGAPTNELRVVLNWTEELKAKVPVKR